MPQKTPATTPAPSPSSTATTSAARGKYRTFPTLTLDQALTVPRAIRDARAGKPMQRLLLADALQIKPSSSNFRVLLSASLKYGLTDGTEKAAEIKLTPLGLRATDPNAAERSLAAREAAMVPSIFKKFYEDYANAKLPSSDMLGKILTSSYDVSAASASDCARLIVDNGTAVGIIRKISGSAHVLLDAEADVDVLEKPETEEPETEEPARGDAGGDGTVESTDDPPDPPAPSTAAGPAAEAERRALSIFIGHGKNHGPKDKLEKILRGFQIPFKVTTAEPNLGRPIPKKVKDTMLDCGSAILIFTKDELLQDLDGNEVWRPSENVVHELGAASFQYEDRVVIFKEKGINFPSNYSAVGYIEFEEDAIEAKAIDLLKELIGFGLVKVTPT